MMARYGATLILLAGLLSLKTVADQTKCPSLAENPSCQCFNFENGILLECPAATADSVKSILEIIKGSVQSLNIYDPDKAMIKLPKHFFPDTTVIKHLQISQSNIQELHDDCLLPLKPYLESFSLVSGRLKEIPQKAFKGLNKLIALDLEANVIMDLPSYSFYGLHLIKLNMKGNQIQKVLQRGHVISANGVSPDPEKIKVLQNYPIPKDAGENKRFVAFANYYRKYIQNFSHIANPLNKLTRNGVSFIWTPDCQKSFETLQKPLISPPILQNPNFSPSNTFILKTDASGKAVGSVLCNGDGAPIAYASRALNKAECNYATIEKELLAIAWSVKHFRPYLYSRKCHFDRSPPTYSFTWDDQSF